MEGSNPRHPFSPGKTFAPTRETELTGMVTETEDQMLLKSFDDIEPEEVSFPGM